ncbi:ABC transporter permease [Porphyromonas pogonae]|uniref:ABC transporter permease n=1 Tax=Porphyromonas pogonae TaxID=867595 RepID=UPI002E795BCA|nr:ABC transporter permease [Porphyromonas pogonae]
MKFEYFIAKRLYKKPKSNKTQSSTRPIVRLSLIGISLSLAVMLMAVSIMMGFKRDVRKYAYSTTGNLVIYKYGSSVNNAQEPIRAPHELLRLLKKTPGVKDTYPIIYQPGIFKTDSLFEGAIFLGVDDTFKSAYFSDNLTQGSFDLKDNSDEPVNPILITKEVAHKINAKIGDKIKGYFFTTKIKVRAFTVRGIYESGGVDTAPILCNINTLRRVNGWDQDQVVRIMINVDNAYNPLTVANDIINKLKERQDLLFDNTLTINSAEEISPEIFSWLDMLDSNIILLLTLLIIVSGFTMITGLIILVLDNTTTIGVLKSLGASNGSIQKIFITLSGMLVGKALVFGNLIAFTLCMVQKYGRIIKLNPETYFMNAVPIQFDLVAWILINAGTLILIMLMIWGPSKIIYKITPAQTMKFD